MRKMNVSNRQLIVRAALTAAISVLPLVVTAAKPAALPKQANAAAAQQASLSSLQTRAENEIDRRVNMLTNLANRLQTTDKLSAGNKTALVQAIQTEISNLTTLKAKIAADTDFATLKNDVQSIPAEYGTFKLIVPKVWLIAASDSILNAVDRLTKLSTALQARITQAQQAGQDVTALNSQLTDINTKINTAKTTVNTVETTVFGLTADGVKANPSALSGYRDQLQSAVQQLQAARNEAATLITQLKALETSSTSSSNSSSTAPSSTTPPATP